MLTVFGILNFCLPMVTWFELTETVLPPMVHLDPEQEGVTEPSLGKMRLIFFEIIPVF